MANMLVKRQGLSTKMLLDVHNFRDNRSYEIVAEIFKKLEIDKNTF